MSAATAIAPPPSPTGSCLPLGPSQAVKRPARPIPEAIAGVPTAKLKATEWALIQLLRHGPVCLNLKIEVSESARPITTWEAITTIASREHRQSLRTP
jgi:hypothetical protein